MTDDRFLASVEAERLARQEDRREAEAFQAKIDRELALRAEKADALAAINEMIDEFFGFEALARGPE